MKIMAISRASALGYGLGLALATLGTSCVSDGELDEQVGSTSSEIVINTNASYTLLGVQSNKCVGIQGASTASTAPLDIETCSNTANQRFRPEAMGGGFFRLRNELSRLCVDVSGAQLGNGAAVIQFTCGTQLNQQWSFTDVAGGAERVTARHSGGVLDVTAQATADGTLLEQFASNNGTNQRFVMTPALPAITR